MTPHMLEQDDKLKHEARFDQVNQIIRNPLQKAEQEEDQAVAHENPAILIPILQAEHEEEAQDFDVGLA